ncbi:zinc finger BED domain-containing protein RICESLEEPER 3-like [Amaranthus tricolor]|uniref:zinc finger BED domain-containing protein RICESLEEPER 3-like n=1 Tax=Amaranthus tricolor TaxID=29722 RepID=UPI002583A3B7|nr:zinc finger BED domain-containing protein RICESLEEPER 3-like [Amaranthus tricolor]
MEEQSEEMKKMKAAVQFCYVPYPYNKGVLSKILLDCFSQFTLENKISSIVVDDATTNDAMMNVLMDKLETSYLILGGDFLHMRCSVHILNLIVRDGLDVIDFAICKVRDCVAFWMSTPKRIETFEQACRLLNVTKPKRVSLDCKTRWNTTYDLLATFLPFKEVFNKLKCLYRRLNFDVPSDHDWQMATLDHINELLAIAGILDPRNKMNCVVHYFKKSYGDDANAKVERVRNNLYNLFDEYKSKCNVNERSPMEAQFEDLGDEDDFARTKRQKIDYVPIKREIDQYLESQNLLEDKEFSILAWWKRDQRYPTLRKVAKRHSCNSCLIGYFGKCI